MHRPATALALIALPAALSAQFRVDPAPLLTVPATTDAGDLRFATAAWATRLSSGEIAVADFAGSSVRILGSDGALKRTLGRSGAGPGEYRLPVWVGRCNADSLYVWDASARLTAYSAAATAAESSATRTVTEGANSLVAACSPAGSVALVSGMQPRRDLPPVLSGESRNGGQYNVVQMSAALVAVDGQGPVRRVRESISQGQWVLGRLSPQGEWVACRVRWRQRWYSRMRGRR